MGEIIDLDKHRPHGTQQITCACCSHTWQAVYMLPLVALECPNCSEMVNEYGTKVYANNCDSCGKFYTVCPYPENINDWNTCQSPDCSSYDTDRDVDKMIDDGIEIQRDDNN